MYMFDYTITKDCELQDVISEGPYVSTIEVRDGNVTKVALKIRQQYNDFDKRIVEKNNQAMNLLMRGIKANEFELISYYESTRKSGIV